MKKREMALVAAINRTGSVTAAAESVGMSQPAASAMLRQLEERLGFDLFTREKRRLALTANGRALLPEIANALSALDNVTRLTDSMRLGKTRRLVIGTVPAAGASLLPAVVARLQAEQPDLAFVLRPGTALEVVDMALEQRIDLGVILGSGANEHVGYRLLASLGLRCMMRPDHRLAARAGITLEELAGERYIGHSRHLAIGAVTSQRLEAAGYEYAPAVEVTQFSTACAFAEEGAGIAIVDSLSAMYAARHGLVMRPLLVASDMPLSLVWPLNIGLSKTARLLAERVAERVAMLTA